MTHLLHLGVEGASSFRRRQSFKEFALFQKGVAQIAVKFHVLGVFLRCLHEARSCLEVVALSTSEFIEAYQSIEQDTPSDELSRNF